MACTARDAPARSSLPMQEAKDVGTICQLTPEFVDLRLALAAHDE